MSATEIVSIIKAINDHVTLKYLDSICGYLNEKTNGYVTFEREFFNEMDKAVQKLINDYTLSLNINPSNPSNSSPGDILREIKIHCDTYNEWKKKMYDNHLHKIELMEKNFNQFVQKTLKAKLVEQNDLFDNALSQSLTPIQPPSTKHIEISNNIKNLNQNEQIFNESTTTNSTVFSNDNDNINVTDFSCANMFKLPLFPTISIPKHRQQVSVPVAPPKPPPPTVIEADDNYQCTICNKQFHDELQWFSHRRTHQKMMKLPTKKKQERKRSFNEIDGNDGDRNKKANKRKRYRFQCEYCDKQYFSLRPYIKHYNYHIKYNKNNICDFCEETFQSLQDLQEHLSIFDAGMSIPTGYYQCCQCEMKFKEKVELKYHLNGVHKRIKDENKLDEYMECNDTLNTTAIYQCDK